MSIISDWVRVAEIFGIEYSSQEKERDRYRRNQSRQFTPDKETKLYLQPRGHVTTSVKVQLTVLVAKATLEIEIEKSIFRNLRKF